MVDLLSPADRASFFSAIRDVTDTFYQSVCTFFNTSAVFDEFDEGANSQAGTDLPCRVTPVDGGESDLKESEQGGICPLHIEIRFNGPQLQDDHGLGFNSFVPEKDYFNYLGYKYKLLKVSNDNSDMGGIDTLIVCFCRREEIVTS